MSNAAAIEALRKELVAAERRAAFDFSYDSRQKRHREAVEKATQEATARSVESALRVLDLKRAIEQLEHPLRCSCQGSERTLRLVPSVPDPDYNCACHPNQSEKL